MPQAAATCSVFERWLPFLTLLPDGQQLSMPFPTMPRHFSVVAPQRSWYEDAPAAFPTLCPSGEVTSGDPSSHFTFRGPGVRGQEQSRAAPVVVALQDWDWSLPGVIARAGGGGSHILA